MSNRKGAPLFRSLTAQSSHGEEHEGHTGHCQRRSGHRWPPELLPTDEVADGEQEDRREGYKGTGDAGLDMLDG